MTHLLFLDDAYIQEFEADVVEHFESGVVLSRSAFYPGGGGQPSDQGTLTTWKESWNVEKVKRSGSKLVSSRTSVIDFWATFWARP